MIWQLIIPQQAVSYTHLELEVAEAANGKLAMEYLQKYQDVDILLTDVKMPYMDGLQPVSYTHLSYRVSIQHFNTLRLPIL